MEHATVVGTMSATYTLHIAAYSPETIPMARLAEYMQRFAKMLGHEDAVHFEDVRPGSTRLAARIEHEQIPKVRARLDQVARGEAPSDVVRAYHELDRLLADDNATGSISEDGERGAEIIAFPGASRPVPASYGPFTEEGSLDGVLISVGGADQTVHLKLQNGETIYTGIETNREIARRLAKHLYEPVRVSGSGRWHREPDGTWMLRRFRVAAFEVLRQTDLRTAVDELRAIPGNDWKTMDDPLAVLRALRDDGNGFH